MSLEDVISTYIFNNVDANFGRLDQVINFCKKQRENHQNGADQGIIIFVFKQYKEMGRVSTKG
jgi:hypothetical protein